MNVTRSGSYIQLHKTGGAPPQKDRTWLIPYSGDIGLSTVQETRQPVREFFKEVGDAIISGADTLNTTLSVGLSLARDIVDLTGIKLMNKGYYTSAWVGEEPATFTTKLDFFRGWKGEWNAYTEVFIPIMEIMNQTVPNDNNVTSVMGLTAPLTTSLEAFAVFGMSALQTALTDATTAVSAVTTLFGGTDNAISKDLNMITNAINNISGITNNTWKVEFGWSNGIDFIPFFTLNQLIVTASSFSFNAALEMQSIASSSSSLVSNKYYPISGTVDLTFKTQNLLASSQFGNYITG